ncbi:hypothetical protein FRC12_001298 [Ceratobasidium sp. 428]|nr:hypothetical protein FRC12_001298 [Ceratobasidium sp. 428]
MEACRLADEAADVPIFGQPAQEPHTPSEGSSQESQSEQDGGSGSEHTVASIHDNAAGSANASGEEENMGLNENEGGTSDADAANGGTGTNEDEGDSDSDDDNKSDSDSDSGTRSVSDSKVDDDEGWDEMMAQQAMNMDIPLPNPHTPSETSSNVPLNLRESKDQFGTKVWIEDYPIRTIGKRLNGDDTNEENTNEESTNEAGANKKDPERPDYPDVGQLKDPEAFKIAKLLLESGRSVRNRNCYLRLKRIRAKMPWSTNWAMMQDVDELPHGPDWKVRVSEIKGDIGTESAEWWCQNAFECLKTLLGDKFLAKHFQFKAYREYSSADGSERVRHEMFTADWMWDTQDKIAEQDPHATVMTVIISSDETRLTTFSGDKKAHPVYMTIGNIPKRLRRRISKRAKILIGYLPVPKLNCITDLEKRRVTKRKIFHDCMKVMLQPLEDACREGVKVMCGDGGL